MLLPKLKVGGLMLLVDVTTYNCVSQKWLPQMLDKGIEEVHAHVVGKTSDTTNVLLFRIQNAYKTEARLHGD